MKKKEKIVCDTCKQVNEEMYICPKCGEIICNKCILVVNDNYVCPKCVKE